MALLNDLLDLAKLEAGKMRLEFTPTDLGVLVSLVADEFASLVAERHLTIRCRVPETGPVVSMDAERIKQVLRNLLSNAVKFSPEGGVVTVIAGVADGRAVVTVADEGPGIPDDELETVFDKFVQSSKTKSGAGGTGLGLSICREILAAHHGRIRAANNPGPGATFTFELPLAPAANPNPAARR